MIDFDRTLETLRESHESPPTERPDAPEWADSEEPRPFRGFCTKCGISLLRCGPLCAVCAFNEAVSV